MFGPKRKTEEQEMIDASRFLSEMKREALTTIVPHPDEKEDRIDLVGTLSGRRPNMYRMHLAGIQLEGLIAMSEKRAPDPSEFDPETLGVVRSIRSHSNSLDSLRAKQVVEIAKSESAVAPKSIMDWIREKGKR